jgi:hypothetical protein
MCVRAVLGAQGTLVHEERAGWAVERPLVLAIRLAQDRRDAPRITATAHALESQTQGHAAERDGSLPQLWAAAASGSGARPYRL